jgi:hypothetical protein
MDDSNAKAQTNAEKTNTSDRILADDYNCLIFDYQGQNSADMNTEQIIKVLHKRTWCIRNAWVLNAQIGLPDYPDENLLEFMSTMLEENNADMTTDILGFVVKGKTPIDLYTGS